MNAGPKPQLLFIADESGAKGYSDNREVEVGELGVMAGYFVPLQIVNEVMPQLESIRAIFSLGDKVHITDLSPADQAQLRDRVFGFFRDNCIRWTYEAVYVEGLHEQTKKTNEIIERARRERKSEIKVSFRTPKQLLHSLLFEGAFAKAVAFCSDHVGSEAHIKVITDHVDKSVLKQFAETANEFLNAGEPSRNEVTGYDPKSKQIVRGTVSSEVTSGAEMLGDYSGITFDIRCEDSPMTLASDVLTNSVYHHLLALQATSPGISLNTSAAIGAHPLSNLIYGTWPENEGKYFSDAVFKHPKEGES